MNTARPVESLPARLAASLSSENTRFGVLLVFVLVVLSGGGASRHDVLSLVLIRPLAFVAISYALIVMGREQLRSLPLPFWLVLTLAGLMVLQLVPLPVDVWSGLPMRDEIVKITQAAGLPLEARPLSLTPGRTWNSLFSLSIPVAAFLLFAIQGRSGKKRIIPIVGIAAAASIGLGLLQIVAGPDSLLYGYRIHTEGSAVGLFANRNHQGLFIACAIVFLSLYVRQLDEHDRSATMKLFLIGAFFVLAAPFILVLGSRAGLIAGVAALLAAPWFLLQAPFVDRLLKKRTRRIVSVAGFRLSAGKILVMIYGVGLAAIIAFAVINSRNEALVRLGDGVGEGALDRLTILPYLLRMAEDFLPFGSGFGSFDRVFKHYEPTAALSTFYLNQAHNDLLQPVIEGGIPAIAIMVLLAAWASVRSIGAWRKRHSSSGATQLAMALVIFLVVAGSAVDYPVRVPIIMMLAAFAISLLSGNGVSAAKARHSSTRT